MARVLVIAGLKAPALYHHFGDKEGLYVTWALEAVQCAGQRMIEGMAVRDGVSAKLVAAADGLLEGHQVDFLQLQHDLARLRRPASMASIKAQMDESVHRPIEAVIDAAVRGSEVVRPTPAVLARLFVHTVMAAHPVYRVGEAVDLPWLVAWFLEGTLDGQTTPVAR